MGQLEIGCKSIHEKLSAPAGDSNVNLNASAVLEILTDWGANVFGLSSVGNGVTFGRRIRVIIRDICHFVYTGAILHFKLKI